MRPKFVLSVLLAACGLMAALALVSHALRPRAGSPQPEAEPASPQAVKNSAPGARISDSEPAATHPAAGARSRDTFAAQRAAQLSAYGTNDDSESLGIILYEMRSSDETIRNAAVEAHELYVERWTSRLIDLGSQTDPQSLDIILSEISSPDAQIRKAALAAVVQFDDRSAIPRLAQLAEQIDDPRQKVAILDTIDFLNLPLASAPSEGDPKPGATSQGLPGGNPR